MKTSSAKNKGRRLVLELREKLLEFAPDLNPQEIFVPASSQPGADLHLSPKAKEIYPYCVECKNVESLNVHKAFEQAKTHQKSEDEVPLLVFKKNRSETMVALRLEDFLKLTR
jgi:hypothetical protein